MSIENGRAMTSLLRDLAIPGAATKNSKKEKAGKDFVQR
jgi:hypothetical protein